MNEDRPLSEKEKAFCIEYLKDWNGSQAAIRAGYSAKTAQEQSSRLLSKVIIKNELKRIQAEIRENAMITIDWSLMRLKNVASASITDFLEFDGFRAFWKPSTEWSQAMKEAVQEMKPTEHGWQIKLHGKNWALDQINRFLGLYDVDNKQRSNTNFDALSVEEKLELLKLLKKTKPEQ